MKQPSPTPYVLVCTTKGLVVFVRKSGRWQYERDVFLGLSVSQALVDVRTGVWWVALSHKHWGAKLHRSSDQGKSWEEVDAPRYPAGTELREGIPASLKLIWALAAGGADQPGRLYVGTEPGGLFRSDDQGATFELVESLWNHPSRPEHWFGGGRNEAGIHSIVVDPHDSRHVYVAVSCAGVFETRDDGQSWQVQNKGLRADYLPNAQAEVGQDPHLLLACEQTPQMMWQQNHCGIFRSLDGGQSWLDVTDPNGLANYGFALAIDPLQPERAWVIPAQSDRLRVAVDRALCVCRTEDGGRSWQAFRKGLPQQHCFEIVYRHALARKGQELIFGTTTGNLFLSQDDGEQWESLSAHLPPIQAVHFT